MKLLTFTDPSSRAPQFGLLEEGQVVNLGRASRLLSAKKGSARLASSLHGALKDWWKQLEVIKGLREQLLHLDRGKLAGKDRFIFQPVEAITFLPPVLRPSAFRDFYAFEAHVRAARKLRGLDMAPDWYKLAIFYFSNPNALYGHKAVVPYPRGTNELDYELEFAAIICNGGRDIPRAEAHQHIAGYTICNDWSARDLQREEMAMSLGPAKGKDFATSFGPCLVTPDELADARDSAGKFHLGMRAWVNGRLLSEGNANDLYHPFEAMIERASMNSALLPGDYIGSGTVGTGCILELRPENTGGWLKVGDTVRMEVERLGVLENRVG